jgi:hypothetical protein
MTTDAPRRLTHDELRPLLHEFAQFLVRQARQPADPGKRRRLVPDLATYVHRELAEPRMPTVEDAGE